MSARGQQFDPVAAAATAGINAADRGIASVASNLDAPELPAQGQAVSSANNAIQKASQFSPANVLATGRLPGLPGQNGGGANIQLPGGQGGGIPSPGELVQNNNFLDPLGVFSDGGGGLPQPPMPGGGNGGGGGGNGGSSSASTSRRRTNPNDLQPSS